MLKTEGPPIDGTTTLVGIFGDPIAHTLSPAMHNAAFAERGLNWRYVPFLVRPPVLGEAVRAIRALGLRGVNVTVPHKEKVLEHLDEVDDNARRIGAVNTIMHEAGRLLGTNTDAAGFVRSLDELGIRTEGARVALLGAGGAARAVAFGLLETVERLLIVNRTVARGQGLADELARVRACADFAPELTSLDGVDLLINTTPLGLHEDDPLPIDPGLLGPETTVCDLVYSREPTALLAHAAAAGAAVADGRGMLLWQGVLAFERWTGIEAPVAVMKKALGR